MTFVWSTTSLMTTLSSPFRPNALSGKVAIVTGGGSGICYEITKQLLLHGCTAAIICGRRESFLQKAATNLSSISGRTCLYKVCDVRDPDACKVCKIILYVYAFV